MSWRCMLDAQPNAQLSVVNASSVLRCYDEVDPYLQEIDGALPAAVACHSFQNKLVERSLALRTKCYSLPAKYVPS